ncbi:MAG: GtrA family protein [Candidatus Neomarinimicrobiota bacterium]
MIFSGLAALTNISARYGFSTLLTMNFTLAIILAHGLGMVVSYTLNRNLNFPRGPRRPIHEIRTYLVVNITGLLITTGLSHLFLAGLVMWFAGEASRTQLETASHITAVALTGIYSFFGHKYFTYREGVRGEFMKIIQRRTLRREQTR